MATPNFEQRRSSRPRTTSTRGEKKILKPFSAIDIERENIDLERAYTELEMRTQEIENQTINRRWRTIITIALFAFLIFFGLFALIVVIFDGYQIWGFSTYKEVVIFCGASFALEIIGLTAIAIKYFFGAR